VSGTGDAGVRVVIVGPGRLGLALGSALRQSGAAARITFQGRSHEPPPHPLFDGEDAADYQLFAVRPPDDTDVLIIAVPDRSLGEVAYELAMTGAAPAGCAALHVSGALSTDALEPLHAVGYSVGSMHPLMAVADPWLAGERLRGIAFALTGEPGAVAAARRLVAALDGLAIIVAAAQRPLYHAAAVLASNYLVGLTGAAVRILGEAGVDADDAMRALIPLLRGTLDNIEQLGVHAALTGPIARGDADTVRLHLARLSPGDRVLYCGLGLELLRLARAAGLDEQRAREIESLLASG
jgi:predicted short-subunit dehydrogenase-like oxidoreductase (DUF2520 family)